MASILVIEDDDFFKSYLEMILTGEGHKVRLCSDGRAGIDSARANPPDVILCDMSMPRMTGFVVIRELKRLPELKQVPIVALSAHDTSADLDEAFEAGATDYVTKPVSVDDLIASVNKALNGDLPAPGT